MSAEKYDDDEECWIKNFCSAPGNEFFVEIDRAFIEDSFNLFGIKQIFPFDYSLAMITILDGEIEYEEESDDSLQHAAEVLYGMIHARFILTGPGLVAMHRRYQENVFGECPRTCCNGQYTLPVGLSDDMYMAPVKLFCPRCRDIFNAPQSRHIDGAYFGSSFPHMFLLTFEALVPTAPTHHYVPRIFGFKVHSSSASIPQDHIHRTAVTHAPQQACSSSSSTHISENQTATQAAKTPTFPTSETHTQPIHNNNNSGVNAEKTDKSSSKDFFDDDEEDNNNDANMNGTHLTMHQSETVYVIGSDDDSDEGEDRVGEEQQEADNLHMVVDDAADANNVTPSGSSKNKRNRKMVQTEDFELNIEVEGQDTLVHVTTSQVYQTSTESKKLRKY